MANEQVIDELIVKLSMDNKDYDKADAARKKKIDATETSEKKADTARNKRDKEKKREDNEARKRDDAARKRLGQTERAVKSLGSTLKYFALTSAAVFGLGAGVGGIVNAITNLAGFETGLRRAAVSTGMSNQEMQAWGATAKRLGADADAGAQAIANLAREQKQFNLTGNGPTMQALARMGVNINATTKPEEALEQAQQIYRRASPAQQQQYEAQLSAQGVSDDLIVMIKSETDARQAYQRSLADSIAENKQSMAALNDALTSVTQASLQLANIIAVSATPYIKEFGDWVHNLASDPHRVDAWLANTAEALADLKTITIALFRVMQDAWKVINAIAHPIAHSADQVHDWLHKGTKDFDTSHGTPFGLFARRALHSVGIGSNPDLNVEDKATDYLQDIDTSQNTAPSPTATAPNTSGMVSARDFSQMLVARGATPAQAMAMTANALRESGDGKSMINPAAVNPNGGASGVFQWTGERKNEFQRIFGMTPDQAPLDTQLDFVFGNATETARMNKALAGGGSPADLGKRFSEIYETHGNMVEDLRRGQLAQTLADQNGSASANNATDNSSTININGPVTVQANDPQQLVSGVQRVALVQPYNTAVR